MSEKDPQPQSTAFPSKESAREPEPADELTRLRADVQHLQKQLDQARHRFSMLSDLMCEAMVLTDERGHVQAFNSRVKSFTGLSAEALIYEYGNLYSASDEQHRPVERATMPLARALRGEAVEDVEMTLHTPDHEVTIHSSAGPVLDSDGVTRGALLVFEDVTRRARAEQRHELLHEISVLLGAGPPGHHEFVHIARRVGEAMGGWTVLGLVHPHFEDLDFVATYHPDPAFDQELWQAARELHIRIDVDPGMGRVARSGRPILNANPSNLAMLPNLDTRVKNLFPRLGCESLLIVPLLARTKTLGVLMLSSLPHRHRYNAADLEYCQQLVDRIAMALDSAQLVNDLSGKEGRLRMLARLSRQFATTLDQQQVLRTVAAQITEALADWCVIGLRDDQGGHIRPAAVYHRYPRKQALLQRLLEGYAPERNEGLAGQVVATRRPLVHENITPDVLERLTLSDESREQLGQLEPSSYICVPLNLRGKFLGYLELACSQSSGRRLSHEHLDLIEELAYRAAYAIQNAQFYEELQGVIRAKDDWLSVASHELKTPLTPLQVQLQLMARRIRKGEAVLPEQTDRCLTQVTRMVALIDELLDVSNVELGQLELHLEPVAIRELAEAVVYGFQDSSELHRIFLLDTGTALEVEGDRARLEQVLVNLLSNAIKYSPEGGDVLVVLSEQEVQHQRCAQIMIQDQGIGIPQSEQHRLFQRYFRGSNVSERNYGGLGLGLWMSHEIVTRHHGFLWAESEEGRGSRFYVAIPLLNPTPASALPARGRLLLVDDDVMVLRQAGQALREGGYLVELANSVQEAMRSLHSSRPDLVLLDVSMPGMAGWTMLRHLHSLSGGERIPVVLIADTEEEGLEEAQVGEVPVLQKPFDNAALLAAVALQQPRAASDSSSAGSAPVAAQGAADKLEAGDDEHDQENGDPGSST